MIRQRIRIRFSKTGDLRLISHRDLVRVWERLFRRAALRLSMSEGFHPKAKLNFPSALGLGIAGLDEVMEVEIEEPADVEQLRRRLEPLCPPGLEILQITAPAEGSLTRAVGARRSSVNMPLWRDKPGGELFLLRFTDGVWGWHESSQHQLADAMQTAAGVGGNPHIGPWSPLTDKDMAFQVIAAPEPSIPSCRARRCC